MFSAFSITARSARLRSTYCPIGSAERRGELRGVGVEHAGLARGSARSRRARRARRRSAPPARRAGRRGAAAFARAPSSARQVVDRRRSRRSPTRGRAAPGAARARARATPSTSSPPQPASRLPGGRAAQLAAGRVLAPQQRDPRAEPLAERVEAARQRLVERRRLAEHARDLALDATAAARSAAARPGRGATRRPGAASCAIARLHDEAGQRPRSRPRRPRATHSPAGYSGSPITSERQPERQRHAGHDRRRAASGCRTARSTRPAAARAARAPTPPRRRCRAGPPRRRGRRERARRARAGPRARADGRGPPRSRKLVAVPDSLSARVQEKSGPVTASKQALDWPDLALPGGVFLRPGAHDTFRGAMARGDVRIGVTLACEECKRRNYQTEKSKRNDPNRIEFRKYCRWCKTHTPHKETAARRPAAAWRATGNEPRTARRAPRRAPAAGRRRRPRADEPRDRRARRAAARAARWAATDEREELLREADLEVGAPPAGPRPQRPDARALAR